MSERERFLEDKVRFLEAEIGHKNDEIVRLKTQLDGFMTRCLVAVRDGLNHFEQSVRMKERNLRTPGV